MIRLPDSPSYIRAVRPSFPKKETLPIYLALRKGLILFREHEFTCFIPKESERSHTILHVSNIGDCGRKHAFRLHQYEEYTVLERENEQHRIPGPYLHLGHMIEAYTVHLLTLGGCIPFDAQEEVCDFDGKVVGHIDGKVKVQGEISLIEIKGLHHERIEKLVFHGVKSAIPHYYDQMQMYMFLLKLSQGYLIALDKNTSEWYIECVRLDPQHVRQLRQKALAILGILSWKDIPEKYVVRKCRFCPLLDHCAEFDGEKTFIEQFELYEEAHP